MKCNNICIIRITEEKEIEQGIEKLFEEIMIKNSPKMMKEKDSNPKCTDSPKQDGPKEAHIKTHHN